MDVSEGSVIGLVLGMFTSYMIGQFAFFSSANAIRANARQDLVSALCKLSKSLDPNCNHKNVDVAFSDVMKVYKSFGLTMTATTPIFAIIYTLLVILVMAATFIVLDNFALLSLAMALLLTVGATVMFLIWVRCWIRSGVSLKA